MSEPTNLERTLERTRENAFKKTENKSRGKIELPEERTTLRYGVPGFSFIIVVLFTSWRIILEELSKFQNTGPDFSGPLLAAFLAFVGGIPTGFIISQLYFLLFQATGGYGKRIDWPALFKRNQAKFKLRSHLETVSKYGAPKGKELIVFDFVLHGSKEEGIIRYLHRRWDIIHSLWSTILALVLALPFGFILVPKALERPVTIEVGSFFQLDFARQFLIICVLFFVFILWLATRKVQKEVDNMHELIVKTKKEAIQKQSQLYKK